MAKRKKSKAEIPKNEGNAYDKILKETAEEVFLPLIEEHFDIKIVKFQRLNEKLQTTLEREMDFFYEVTTETAQTFILHLEFETNDNSEMVYRIGEYHGIELRRKQVEIKHLVIYLGNSVPKMRTQLEPNEIYSGFDLINLKALNAEELLSSQVPNTVIMAILANYPPEKTEYVLRFILQKLRTLIKNESELTKYFSQLTTLSRLRKIEDLTIKIKQEMPITYDIETDYLYNVGIAKGVTQGISLGITQGEEKKAIEKDYKFVKKLLEQTDFSDEKIAEIVETTVAFVKKVRREIGK